MQSHHYFAAIVAVHYAYLVGGSKPLLCGKAAARIDKSRISHGQFNGYARVYDFRAAGLYDDGLSGAGIQVRTGGKFAATYGGINGFLNDSFFVPEHNFVLFQRGLYKYDALVGRAAEQKVGILQILHEPAVHKHVQTL